MCKNRFSDVFYTYKAQFLEANLTFHTVSVPKLVKNGFNSLFRGWVSLRGIKSEWRTGTVVNDKKRIITIFDHFRNTHARC
jgi:hypothetical protein